MLAARRKLCLMLLLALSAATPGRAAGRVALTFDDLPVFGRFGSIDEATALTDTLLAGLKRNHWRATGFVNEIQLDGPDRERRVALLSRWLDAGMDLGNHSYSHLSLTNTPVDAYIADVARGETVTKALLAARGRHERWYRYPYLETGTTLAIRHRFESWLADHGYRVAPVTIENSDWEFAVPYDAALVRGDRVEAEHIRQAYIAFTARIVPWYRQAAIGLLGREPAFVFLLHASRLNADSLKDLVGILRAQDLHVVTLDKAMRDPAYRLEDTYAGPDGDEWLSRWSLTLHKNLPWASLPQVPTDIVDLDSKLEPQSPSPAPTPAPSGK
jgi:peptidoglycan/xylan/chitin deacetylase (PgdA/CDA1 family)